MLPSGDWQTWAIIAGRGWGKSRVGAETVRQWAEAGGELIALVGRTAADVRDVMIEGPSGIIACSHPRFMPVYEPSKRRLTWPNGTLAIAYSADQPDRLRGPQHSRAWVDELAAWRYLEAWQQLQYGMRIGRNPQTVITTTPRPLPLLREILGRSGTVFTRGSTYENRANLAPSFFAEILSQYEGTRMGRQEILAEILEDVEGALWTPSIVEKQRWPAGTPIPSFVRVVVGVDPAITQGQDRDETGIVVVGLTADKRAFVIDDASLDGSPADWAEAAMSAHDHHQADCLVVETNRGGSMVSHTLRSVCHGRRMPRIKTVTATRGKVTRAEPFVALYERGRIYHIGQLARLEDQMCSWVPGETRKSPDRMDALVWALTDLFPAHGQFRAVPTKPEGW